MTGFSFETTPRILCEDGAALKLAEFLTGMGVSRPFIVTDAGLVSAGVVQPILDALKAAGGLIFSLALSMIALMSLPAMGMVAPVGGVLMIAGWLVLLFSALRGDG